MWGSENSIEPVRAVSAVAVTADGRTATRSFVEPPIREATPGDLVAAARRARSGAEPDPVQAVPETRGGFFRRRVAEPEQPDALAQRLGLYTATKRDTRHYFADYQQKREVMRAGPKSITTKRDDKQTVSAMLDLAQSRGWQTIRVKGTADFQREAWVQTQTRGMIAEGYKPSETDRQEAARRIAAAAPVQAAAPAQAPAVKAASAAAVSAAPVQVPARVTNSVTPIAIPIVAAAPVKAEAAIPATVATATLVKNAQATPAEAIASQPKQSAAKRSASAAPAPAARATIAPATAASVSAAPAAAAPAAVQAEAVANAKQTPAQRNKAVWGAVETAGKQARASDPATAKATAGERAGTAATS